MQQRPKRTTVLCYTWQGSYCCKSACYDNVHIYAPATGKAAIQPALTTYTYTLQPPEKLQYWAVQHSVCTLTRVYVIIGVTCILGLSLMTLLVRGSGKPPAGWPRLPWRKSTTLHTPHPLAAALPSINFMFFCQVQIAISAHELHCRPSLQRRFPSWSQQDKGKMQMLMSVTVERATAVAQLA